MIGYISRQNLERQAEINKAFLEGYERGKREGETNALLSDFSLNQIREILGLQKIEEKSVKQKGNEK